jgi:hypothetical protein
MQEVNDNLNLLREWSGRQSLLLTLVYRGSRDGFSLHNYVSKVTGKGPLFVFIKSEHNLVFGFFTSLKRG